MAHERKCSVCGKTYEYCPRCRQYASLPKWKLNFCDEACKEVYDTVDKFVFKHISAEDAKEVIAKSSVVVKNDKLQKIIASILVSEDKKKKKGKPIQVDPIEEEIVNED